MAGSVGTDEPLETLLVLLKRRPTGWAELVRDLRTAGSYTAVLDRCLTDDQPNLFDDVPDLSQELSEASEQLATWREEGIRVIGLLQDAYPRRLLDMKTPPPLLFLRGTPDPRDASGVCVVGSRRADTAALSRASEAAGALSDAGHVVISGLAAGIDTAALTSAKRKSTRSVAVIGTGIRRYYPAENKALQEHIAATGLLISQFWPDAPPTKFTFPMRNELMSAWSAATYVVQADARSGARLQARVALEQGRLLFLDRTLLPQDWAREYSQRPGVHVVGDAQSLIDIVQSEIKGGPDGDVG